MTRLEILSPKIDFVFKRIFRNDNNKFEYNYWRDTGMIEMDDFQEVIDKFYKKIN